MIAIAKEIKSQQISFTNQEFVVGAGRIDGDGESDMVIPIPIAIAIEKNILDL